MSNSAKNLCAAIGLALVSVQARPSNGEWHNSLKPAGAAAGEVMLVHDGQPACKILIADAATTPERKAAEELQHWLKEITGAQVPILALRDAAPAAAAPPVYLRIRLAPDLPGEGYRIGLNNYSLTLDGGPGRGVVNAVYAFLEEDLACRFYTKDSIKLPNSKTLIVAPAARTYAPKLRLRDPFYNVAWNAEWSLRNRTNAPSAPVPEEYGGHVDYANMFVHTAAQLAPPGEYFSAHPEYFYLDAAGKRSPAQLCATEPEVIKIATAYVLDVLSKNPHTEIVSISKNDSAGNQLCQCERCKKLRADEGGAEMACQLVLVNGVAEAVEKQYPHVTIDTLAYLDTVGVPKTMRPRSNVAVRLCNDTVGAWGRPFTPARDCPVAQLATAWGAACKRIYIWDYTVNFSHYLAPMPNVDVMADDVRFWVEHNAEGVMLQGAYQGPGERDELKAWVMSKLLWDPSRDVDALVADFIEGHYGKTAPAMFEYEKLLADNRQSHAAELASPPGGIRYPMKMPFFSAEFFAAATEIFDRALKSAAGDEALVRRVDRARLPILYAQCINGPDFVGADYNRIADDFARIARQEGVTALREGPADLEERVAEFLAKKTPAAK